MKQTLKQLLAQADIQIDGDRPWDIHVHNEEFYPRVLGGGSLGLGESYVAGWWDCQALDQCLYKILKAGLYEKVTCLRDKIHTLAAIVINQQRKAHAFDVGEHHYDIGNDLYQKMLDKRMVYSCGYWKNAHTLDDAQEAKLELICQKIHLQPGMRVLDIGCGWGCFAKYAAEKYQAEVMGITVSKEQVELAEELCRGLPVEIVLQDYRDLNPDVRGKFDAIVSIGMFEHVGYKNYHDYFDIVSKCLHKEGLFLLHTMGNNKTIYDGDPWIDKYIFPGGTLPSVKQVGEAIEGKLVMEDWHSFGADYVKTLHAWHTNFRDNWPLLRARYDERFRRMWEYYLLLFAAAFEARYIQLWQIVFSKNRAGGYQSIR
jgi:cyclopropane-fatty-acyl-phospholipid synthase